MSSMQLSFDSSSDTKSLLPRNQLLDIIQKDQDEAMSVLDANPFIAGLLLKHAKGNASLVERQELFTLRAANNALRQDCDRLQAELETVKQQKKAAETISTGLELQLAVIKEEKEKGLKEIEALSKSLAKTEADFSETKLKAEKDASNFQQALADTKEKAARDTETAEAKLKKLQARYNFLWETISERDPDAAELANDKAGPKPSVKLPSESLPTPVEPPHHTAPVVQSPASKKSANKKLASDSKAPNHASSPPKFQDADGQSVKTFGPDFGSWAKPEEKSRKEIPSFNFGTTTKPKSSNGPAQDQAPTVATRSDSTKA